MSGSAVIELSSDSNSSNCSVENKEYDRIAALINKYGSEELLSARTERRSDSDDETVLVSAIDEENKAAPDNNINEKIEIKFSSCSALVNYGSSSNLSEIGNETLSKELAKDCKNSTQHRSEEKEKDLNGRDLQHVNTNTSDSADNHVVTEAEHKKTKRKATASEAQTIGKTKRIAADKESKKLEKELQQQKKKEEREQNKQAVIREKLLKRALQATHKNIKPNECIKYITVQIDPAILNESYGPEILCHLKDSDVAFKVNTQLVPHTVTWKREAQTHLMDDNGSLIASSEITDTQDVLMLMNWEVFVNHVHDRSLLTYVKNVSSVNANRKLYLGIHRLKSYFNYIKGKKKKEIDEIHQTQKPSKADKIYAAVPVITKRNVEYALTELQLFCNCCYRMTETPQDVALMIGQFSKAIAQLPYKLEKNLKHQESEWYMAGDKRDTVGVDKDGNGLQRLWNQQLCCFPLARLEIAEAISSQYATPTALMQAYEGCSLKEGEQLLQDIPIRRAAGPIATARKIGPELSKKIYSYFISTNESTIL